MSNTVELVLLMRDKTRQALSQAGQNVDGLSKDYDELIHSIRASEVAMEASSTAANRMGSDYDKLNSIILKFGGAAALTKFGKEIIDVRSEIEMMEKSFNVLLSSEEQAAKMLAELKSIAVKSPLTLTDVSKGAQTLLSFNIEAEKVIPIIEQIGNISMGNSDKFNSLVLAFSQMYSTGKLMGQDLLQMINAGFNPLSVIAEKTGKSIGELKKEMEDGAISAEMVADAFQSVTAEGGKFYGMMEAQSEGIAGLKASLEDAWVNMLNEIGKGQEGLIADGYKLTTTLIQNYETVGKILLSLVATYGTYKAAVILATVAENGWTIAEVAHYNILLLVEKAQKLLNKTMLSNPYVLVATAVVGLATAIWALSSRTDAQTESLKRLKDLQDDYTKSIEGEKTQIDILFGRLRAAKEGTEEYQKAKDNIISKYGNYLDGLSEEIRSLRNVEAAYKAISAAAIQAAKDRAIEKGTQDAIDTYTNTWGNNIKKIQEKFTKKFGEAQGTLLLDGLKESLQDGKELPKEVQDAIKSFDIIVQKGGYMGMGGYTDTENNVSDYIDNLTKSKTILNKEVKEIESIFGKATKKEETGEEKTEITTYTKQVEEAGRKVDELKKSIKDLRKGIRPEGTKEDEQFDFLSAIEAKQKALDEAEKKLATLTGQNKKTTRSEESAVEKVKRQAQEQAAAQQKLINNEVKAVMERRAIALENEQKLLDIQNDGFDKRQKQIELNHRKELLAIDKHAQELIEKQQESEKLQWEKEGKKGTFTPTTTGIKQLPREQKNELIQQETTLNKTTAAETEQLLKDMLEPYRTFAQQRLDIEKKYREDIADLRKAGASEENIQIAEQSQAEALAALDEEMAQKEATFQDFIYRIGNMSLEQLEKSLRDAEKALEKSETTTGKDSKQTGILRAKVNKLQEEIKAAKAEYEIKNSNEEEKWNKTSAAIKKCKKEVDGILESLDFLDESTKSALQAASNIADSAIAMIDGIKILAVGASASISAVEKASIILTIISAAFQVISAIFNMASASEKRHQEALKEVMENRLAMQRQYNLLLLEQNLLLEEASSIFGEKQIEKAANAIKVYGKAISLFKEELKGPDVSFWESAFSAALISNAAAEESAKRYNAYMQGIGALQSITIKTGHEKTGLFGWGKGYDVYSSILDVYGKDNLLNSDGSLNINFAKTILDTQTLNDENKKLLQSLIDLQEEANKAQEALRDYLQETFGALGSDLMDSIAASIQDKGVSAWEAFGDAGAKVIENLGKQLAYELFFADKFSKLQEDIKAIYKNSTDPEEIARRQMELVGQFYQTIEGDMETAQAFMENWQKKASEYGFDLWQGENGGSSQSGKAGAFTTMTQDQGTKLEGLFTSVQMHTANIDEIVTNMSASMYAALDSLMRIAENTEYCRLLEVISSDVKLVIRDGLKMK